MIRNKLPWLTMTWVIVPLLALPAGAQQQTTAEDQTAEQAGNEPPPADPAKQVSPTVRRAEAFAALQKGDHKTAIAAGEEMLRDNPKDAATARVVGDIYLRTGKVQLATEQFNRFVKAEPDELPYLWQRGISLYFTGDFEEAARQFEEHRKVNPNDVENAAWHFLCVAKAKSFDEAKRLVLPAPGDPRIPMQEVLEMLSNGDTDAVVARVDAVPADSRAHGPAHFYGDFYLGLYADAKGETDKALMYLSRSAKDAPRHYMGDVARVYAKYLEKKKDD